MKVILLVIGRNTRWLLPEVREDVHECNLVFVLQDLTKVMFKTLDIRAYIHIVVLNE